MKSFCFALLAVLAFLQPPPSAAATLFWPTAGEWASWPEYCRAKYAYLRSSETLEFGPPVSPSLFNKYEASLGRAWVFVHHHCAGLGYFQRANLAGTANERTKALGKARDESRFSFDRTPTQLPIYAEIATHLGTIARASKDSKAALRYFEIARQTHPEYPGGYQGAALVLQDDGKYDAAIEILLAGNEATQGSSAEIHYFLGMAYLKLNQLDEASEHATQAYSLGYPLPGLRNKLAALGRPLN